MTWYDILMLSLYYRCTVNISLCIFADLHPIPTS